MNSITVIFSIIGFLQMGLPLGNKPVGNQVLVGRVIRYDASLSVHTSQGDMVIRTGDDGKHVRLRYAPNGFGFDAPPAKDVQLLPRQMFSGSNSAWSFHVHSPRDREETNACTAVQKQYAPDGHGQVVEVERYTTVPGESADQSLRPESLPCLILDSWDMIKSQMPLR
jgi:hypothetical protein